MTSSEPDTNVICVGDMIGTPFMKSPALVVAVNCGMPSDIRTFSVMLPDGKLEYWWVDYQHYNVLALAGGMMGDT